MTDANTRRKSLSTIERAFEIIEHVKAVDGARVSEVAADLDLPKSTAYNHLSTLEQLGYLVKEGDEYHISLQFLDLGGYTATRKKANREALPKLKALARETGERAQFVVEENGYGYFIYGYLGDQAVQTDVRMGMCTHLHTTSAGKSILANLPPSRVTTILDGRGLPERTRHTITDRDQLETELEAIRERGFAFNREERIEGQNAVGVPLMLDGRVVGALSVSGPTNRMKGDWFEQEIPDLLLGTANELELNLSFP